MFSDGLQSEFVGRLIRVKNAAIYVIFNRESSSGICRGYIKKIEITYCCNFL